MCVSGDHLITGNSAGQLTISEIFGYIDCDFFYFLVLFQSYKGSVIRQTVSDMWIKVKMLHDQCAKKWKLICKIEPMYVLILKLKRVIWIR